MKHLTTEKVLGYIVVGILSSGFVAVCYVSIKAIAIIVKG